MVEELKPQGVLHVAPERKASMVVHVGSGKRGILGGEAEEGVELEEGGVTGPEGTSPCQRRQARRRVRAGTPLQSSSFGWRFLLGLMFEGHRNYKSTYSGESMVV